MNKALSHWILCFLLSLSTACGSVPNKGIEVGNPDLKGKVLTLTPKELPETFLLDFEAAGDVIATRIRENEVVHAPATLESADASARITATFADSTHLEVELTFDESGEIADAVLRLNGQPVELESVTLHLKSIGQPNFKQAALGVAEQLCAKLTECGAETSLESCTETVLDIPGLAASLGGSEAESLREMQAEQSSGAIETDDPSLEACFWEISQMPCAQTRKARPPSHPQADSNIRQMIPRPSCASGFRPKGSLR
jgi:hypothetical protein